MLDVVDVYCDRVLADVAEHRPSPDCRHGLRARDERHRRNDHFVVGLELESGEREVERGASACDGNRVVRADDLLDPHLERSRHRSHAEPA
jgi:hypothetical protein